MVFFSMNTIKKKKFVAMSSYKAEFMAASVVMCGLQGLLWNIVGDNK